MQLNTNQKLGVHNHNHTHNRTGTRWYHSWLEVLGASFPTNYVTIQNFALKNLQLLTQCNGIARDNCFQRYLSFLSYRDLAKPAKQLHVEKLCSPYIGIHTSDPEVQSS